MIDVIKTIIDFFLNPLHILCLLLLLAFFLYRKERFFWLKRVIFITILFFLITATYPIPNLILKPLENMYPALMQPGKTIIDQPIHILVLGSGHTRDPDLPRVDQLSYSALNRLVEGIRLNHILPNSTLIFSGYGKDSPLSQAEANAETAISLGVDERHILQQSLPTNTKEEILAYQASFANKGQLILVTSAYHMPRAMLIGKKLGLDPIAAPTDFQVMHDPEEGFNYHFFSGQNFQKTQTALHEYIGILYEKLF